MRLELMLLCAALAGCGAVRHPHPGLEQDPRVPHWVTTHRGNIVLQRPDKTPCYYPVPTRAPAPTDTLAWVHLYTYLVQACLAGQLGQSQEAVNPEDEP